MILEQVVPAQASEPFPEVLSKAPHGLDFCDAWLIDQLERALNAPGLR